MIIVLKLKLQNCISSAYTLPVIVFLAKEQAKTMEKILDMKFSPLIFYIHSYFSHAKGLRLQLRSPTYSSHFAEKGSDSKRIIKPEQLLAENWAHAEHLMVHPRQIFRGLV